MSLFAPAWMTIFISNARRRDHTWDWRITDEYSSLRSTSQTSPDIMSENVHAFGVSSMPIFGTVGELHMKKILNPSKCERVEVVAVSLWTFCQLDQR